MGRRSDHSREELAALALDAARRLVEAKGLQGLTARAVAARIGYSAGTLYNLFDDLDDLVLRLNGDTLDRLYASFSAASPSGRPDIALKALARTYIDFVREQPTLWALVFERHKRQASPPPGWYREKVERLFMLTEKALAPLFAPGEEGARRHSARVLWSSVHGMCALEAAGAVGASAAAMADSLVTHYVAGLRASKK